MTGLAGKKILLGVSGGIAAYKAPELVRRLRDRGAEVRVMMTSAARAFITPLSLQAVSGYPVFDDLLDPAAEAAMGHIELAKWADLIVLAPASADLIARITAGMANDLVTTTCLASDAPLALVPAMNQQMYRAAITQENLQRLQQRGVMIWGPDSGSQACGEVGPGRMAESADVVAAASALFASGALGGLRVLITAGPTREAIDPVRYITNHSSGKMGYAVATAAREAGAAVTLVSGPTQLAPPAGQRDEGTEVAGIVGEGRPTEEAHRRVAGRDALPARDVALGERDRADLAGRDQAPVPRRGLRRRERRDRQPREGGRRRGAGSRLEESSSAEGGVQGHGHVLRDADPGPRTLHPGTSVTSAHVNATSPFGV